MSTNFFPPKYGDKMTLCAILSTARFILSTSVAPTTTSDEFGMLDMDKLLMSEGESVDGIVSIVSMVCA